MASSLRVNLDDLDQSQDGGTCYAIESAAVGSEGKYLRAHANGDIDSLVDTNERYIGHDMLWIIETTSGGTMHMGRQFTIRNAKWADNYLHVNSHGPGRYTVDCKVMEEENDGRAHYYFVRSRPDSNALAIGSVGSPGIFIQMERSADGQSGEGGVVNCNRGCSTSSWFYLMQLEL